jgi:hypothetical protein
MVGKFVSLLLSASARMEAIKGIWRVFMSQVMSEPEEFRVTLRLSSKAQAAVEEIKKLGGFKTTQEAVRRAISDELFLQQQLSDGWTVLLRKGNEYRELVWPKG